MHSWVGEIGQGCWQVCKQVCMTLLHIHKGFSHLNEIDIHDIIRWCHCHSAYVNEGKVKRKHAWALEFIHSLLVLGSLAHSLVGLSRKPQTLWLGYLSASWGVGLSPYRKVFFICSFIHVHAYFVYPELVHFSCLWLSQVTCHPASIGSRVAHVG